jgi:cytochrome c oxidase subunit 2
MFSGPTDYAESVDSVMLYIIFISVVLLLGITFFMIYFVIKYNKRRNPKAEQIEGNLSLEIIWIVIPTILVLSMFWYGFVSFKEMRQDVEGAMTVNVTGQMWQWKFKYENGIETDTLYIPVFKVTKLLMKSMDVNHSFYIPAFRQKEDVMPNRVTYLILKPKKLGSYNVACAEYCGLQHSAMYTKVVVMTPEEFNEWYYSYIPEGTDKGTGAGQDTTKTDSLNTNS